LQYFEETLDRRNFIFRNSQAIAGAALAGSAITVIQVRALVVSDTEYQPMASLFNLTAWVGAITRKAQIIARPPTPKVG